MSRARQAYYTAYFHTYRAAYRLYARVASIIAACNIPK